MYKETFVIPSVPPSNNQNQGHSGKGGMYRYQQIKKLWADGMAWEAYGRKPKEPLKQAAVTISYYFKDNRRRDPDNYSGKMILDALVKNGIIADDSAQNIIAVPFFGKDKNYIRTEITVKETDDLSVLKDKIKDILTEFSAY